jgi:hypothetical protein
MVLGKENLDTLTSMKNLELVPSDQGMYEQAGRDASTSIRAMGDGAGQGASFHTNEHEKPGRSAEGSGQVRAFTAIPLNLHHLVRCVCFNTCTQ